MLLDGRRPGVGEKDFHPTADGSPKAVSETASGYDKQ